ncbi:MAG: hypothetical protein ACREYD_02075 [Casimicrobiaceae bacterium]
MRILLVGALSWHPERMRSLCERGHRLWGLWSRSMVWDQGPYAATADCIAPIALAEAATAIRDLRIDCIYSLFQAYHRRLWGPPADGVEHDVWTILRTLLGERERGRFDAPVVRHWGFDVQQMDPVVTRALDGHVFCNRQKRAYWSEAVSQGGCGVDAFDDRAIVEFLDSDRPKLEFMNDDLSDRPGRSGEIHTVCIGRPFGIDYLAAARRSIHVHTYGNDVDDVYRMISRDLSLRGARREAALLRRFLHVHPSLQASGGASWEEVRRAKAGWVREFSRYDAGWSYIGSPLPWEALDDRAAIPNRIGTYLLAGLPVITDFRPGYYRYDELARLGANIDLVDADYDGLRSSLDDEIRTRERRANALRARAGCSFEATIDPLLDVFERTRTAYFARPHRERSHFAAQGTRLIHFGASPDPRAAARGLVRRLLAPPAVPGASPAARLDAVLRAAREPWRNLLAPWKAKVLSRQLRGVPGPAAPTVAAQRQPKDDKRETR